MNSVYCKLTGKQINWHLHKLSSRLLVTSMNCRILAHYMYILNSIIHEEPQRKSVPGIISNSELVWEGKQNRILISVPKGETNTCSPGVPIIPASPSRPAAPYSCNRNNQRECRKCESQLQILQKIPTLKDKIFLHIISSVNSSTVVDKTINLI